MHPYFPNATRAACALCLLLATSTSSLANVLVNPGFEADAIVDAPLVGVSGWTTFGTANTASANTNPTRSGIGSLKLSSPVDSTSGAFQSFAASAGETWDFQGYMRALSGAVTDPSFGLLKIVWSDGFVDLDPVIINFGDADNALGFPGITADPFLNSANANDTWVFARAQGVAPAGTTAVKFFALLVNPIPSNSSSTAFFDDLQANRVPEPGSLALVLVALLALPLARTRRG